MLCGTVARHDVRGQVGRAVWCATGGVRSQESEGSEESEGVGRGDLHTGREVTWSRCGQSNSLFGPVL